MRILLAEDEKELSNALTMILKHNNYSVDAVYNGEDALHYLDAENYDAAILDVMMPKMDGITVLRQVRAQGNTVPVLILTAKAEVDDRVLGLDSGADDYLTKPFAAKELLARLRSITRRQMEIPGNLLNFGNLSLDRSKYELSSSAGIVRLGNKEYQMMEMLMGNPGQVISTEHFMERIWGYDSEAERSVVWVYLSNLRKKLVSLKADVQIKAARNQGYSLEKKS
ncbi:MAG: response regulator transcription factor [Blautia sp.]|uniref:response regulator transcription factor n=1 Tax=Blautia sp. TaxID=1955243 RepID=UPI002A758AD1|nr:response regulator transcription factor [Blautia sp.]MDY3017364.1 response regulator transcription factor [Blautia sp.]